MNVDFFGGQIDAVRIAVWNMGSDAGLTAWRTDMANSSGESMTFSMRFEDQPVSLSTLVIRPKLAPVTMQPTGQRTVGLIGDASSFERFVPQWRWLLVRLGLFDRDMTPIRGAGGGLLEPFDPWVGLFSAPLHDLMEEAILLDRRLEAVNQGMADLRKKELSHGASRASADLYSSRAFGRLQRKMDPDLAPAVSAFVEGFTTRGVGQGILDRSIGYLNQTAAHEACFEATGEMCYEIMRNNRRGSFVHVDDWSGHSVSALLRWLSDPTTHLQWSVLDEAGFESWFQQATSPGELSLPSEEIDIYELTGEPLPYVWNNRLLSVWAKERWA